jgi:hypothetical protein
MSSIPTYARNQLPSRNISVNKFLAVSIPPCVSATARLTRIEKYISEQPPNITHVSNLSKLLSPSAEVVKALKRRIGSEDDPISSILCPHLLTAGGARYPLWVAEFWHELHIARGIQENWRRAAHQLDARLRRTVGNHLLQDAAGMLSHLPWTGNLLGHRKTIDLCHLWVYFTNEWLTDDHLLIMLGLLMEDLSQRYHQRVFIENTHFATILTAAYHDRENYATENSYGWIRKRGNELANSSKAYLATIVNQDNIHWVPLLMDFDENKIWYGDSTGHPMESKLRDVVEWWTFYHTGLHFTHATLATSLQHDSFSCGMLAWDALQFRLGNSVIRIDPLRQSDERLKVFHHLVKYYKTGQVSDELKMDRI